MNNAYENVLDVIEEHRRDGYRVTAVRVDSDTYNDLLTNPCFIKASEINKMEFDNKDSMGKVAGKEIILDEEISEPVADDVELK